MAQKQVVVVGLGRFGSSVTRTLYQMGYDVLALDWDERLVQNAMGNSTYAVKADATSEAVLRELGVHNFDGSVVAIGSNIEARIMATVLVKSFEYHILLPVHQIHYMVRPLKELGRIG